MENELVRYSRAGDVFHYRWAARRCLRMIYPNSQLRYITIEGSKERELAGEYVIDVAEYSGSAEDGSQEIAYFQLKHTTVRKEQPFDLSDLKGTIEGFAKRYVGHLDEKKKGLASPKVVFSIVTNRPIAESFKQNVLTMGKSDTANTRFRRTIEQYSNLKGNDLANFCASLQFVDGEGDYDAQRYELHVELSQLLAGTVDNPLIDSITALVHSKALPKSDGQIVREEIYKCFGVTSDRDMYPAPPKFEKLDHVILRKQHHSLLYAILEASTPIIIHAAGGVGKSVFARQIAGTLSADSMAVVYDCFGGGSYRNRSETRHQHRDGLIQIANELAAHGLCDPLLAQSISLEKDIMRQFLNRINMAVTSLRKTNENAILIIVIDAADNAEMASKEFSQPCFVHELLRESLPDGCRIVALCRTERIHLLQPTNEILKFELKSFLDEETLIHLRSRFPDSTNADGLEFHRLTNGNPRVQANALNSKCHTVLDTLSTLGPRGTTVNEQIEKQLDLAILSVKESHPAHYQSQIEAICTGLATLPPFIPLSVLATAANVNEATVHSFVADLGRPLWLSDNFVQFRDEPTETWFREKFSATEEQISLYITVLKPLATEYSYVSETLPSLFLQAGKYDELIDTALSDKLLPRNPIDERNVRVYRLQFAFKAALKLERYKDAIKIAIRAGEEVSGDKRQLELLTKNVDLIASLQNEQKVQELAFRRLLGGTWDGSENVYSASLLSSVEEFKGEARGYLRAAHNWLRLYLEERKKSKEEFSPELLKDEDIVELTYAHFNLSGVSKTIDFILSWHPAEVVYRIARKFIRRLVDAGDFDSINEIPQIYSRNQYLMIALAHELLEVGCVPSVYFLETCLDLLTTSRARIPQPRDDYSDTIAVALISFLEACAARNLSKTKILRVLRHYYPIRASMSVSSNHQEKKREIYLRMIALKFVLTDNTNINLEELMPKALTEKEHKSIEDQNIREFKEVLNGLLPWYVVRARILINEVYDFKEEVDNADKQSKSVLHHRWKDYDALPYEISKLCIEIIMFSRNIDGTEIKKFFASHLNENQKILTQDRLKGVRAAFRLGHLSGIRSELEHSTSEVIASLTGDPETKAESYIDLARAVFSVSRDDAVAYFDYAIEAVSKFGDEMVERWETVVALANRSAEGEQASPELAYRFIRCAELIGDNVAREKYWNRDEAIRTCVRLSPVSALSALSRWRDRDVGWFDQQFPALAEEMASYNYLSPTVAWSLSAFLESYELDKFASLCIERETSAIRQKHILESVIRDLRLNNATKVSWQKLKQVAEKYSIENNTLNGIIAFYDSNPEVKKEEIFQQTSYLSNYETETIDWEDIFINLELTSNLGISRALQRFDEIKSVPRNHRAFWKEVFNRINNSDITKFLNELVIAEKVDMVDMKTAIACIPDEWHRKVSVKRNWGLILESIARRFAAQLTERGMLKYFNESIQAENEMVSIESGILAGLSNNNALVNASTFFGFAKIASKRISPEEAEYLLDFALGRFELHIDDDFADGNWSNCLLPPRDLSMAWAGFVWASLGSPRTKTRWQAAHCVRRLAEGNCESEIDALITWMQRDKADAFGSPTFPFYNLHARLYLLIALARISIDIPQILMRHQDLFTQYALSSSPHILIQKYAADIIHNIEKAFPNTYSRTIVEGIHKVGMSQLPIKEIQSYSEVLNSYWHKTDQVDTTLKFYHGYDFDHYWFAPLGSVFGIPEKQVEELATHVVINDWYVDNDGGYQNDPRSRLWRSHRNESETRHSHGSYPRTDDYSFYLSFHALFVVAAKIA
ncbi:ATP-binding protein [Paenibacillus agricola]|uniref:ATP-binding protein n=1 Tax=Paenibacillus agricola TaxID=2716264 RepID=UPI001FB7E252|nr:ATP-binding protein [Paenibacillus agricola]